MRRVISVDENSYYDIQKQGIPNILLFSEKEWETNSRTLDKLKGAVLISGFIQGELYRMYFRTPEGKIMRLKIPQNYLRKWHLEECIKEKNEGVDKCKWVAVKLL